MASESGPSPVAPCSVNTSRCLIFLFPLLKVEAGSVSASQGIKGDAMHTALGMCEK